MFVVLDIERRRGRTAEVDSGRAGEAAAEDGDDRIAGSRADIRLDTIDDGRSGHGRDVSEFVVGPGGAGAARGGDGDIHRARCSGRDPHEDHRVALHESAGGRRTEMDATLADPREALAVDGDRAAAGGRALAGTQTVHDGPDGGGKAE